MPTVYLGIGVGIDSKAHPYYREAVRALRGLGFTAVRAVTELPTANIPTVEEIKARMDSCAAVILPLCLLPLSKAERERVRDSRVPGTPARPELGPTLELMEREFQVLSELRNRIGPDDEPRLSQVGFGSSTSLKNRVLIPNGKAEAVTSASQGVTRKAQEFWKKARSCHGLVDFFETPQSLHLLISSVLLSGLPGLAKVLVMVSSTTKDFEQERPILTHTFACLGHSRGEGFELLNFEEQTTDRAPLAASIRLVRESTVYLGMIKSRYGFAPERLSLTHEEYEEAKRLGKPRYFLFGDVEEYAAGVNEYMPTEDETRKVEEFKQEVLHDRTPVRTYYEPDEIPDHVIEMLDWLTRPGVDQHALPPPQEEQNYVAHPYVLLENDRQVVRSVGWLDDWLDDRRSPGCLAIEALGGMGKSALAWDWFRRVKERDRPGPPTMWWSFYAADADVYHFALYALQWLRYRVGKPRVPLPEGRIPERQLLEAVLAQVRRAEGRFLFILDGAERILTFYKHPAFKESARDKDGPAVEDRLAFLADQLALRKETPLYGRPDLARDYLLTFEDDANTLESDAESPGVDRSAFAWFLRELAADGKDRVLMTTRFTPTAVQALAREQVDGRPLALERKLEGLSVDEARRLWSDSAAFGLIWEPDELDDALGGGSLPRLCTETLQGYALPIAMLAQLVKGSSAGGSFRRWKESLPELEKKARWCELRIAPNPDDVRIDPARQRMIALVERIMSLTLKQFPQGGPHDNVLQVVLRHQTAVAYSTLRDELIRRQKVIEKDRDLRETLDDLRRKKLIGRDNRGLLHYEMHPLLREAVRFSSPDRDEGLQAEFQNYAAEWEKVNAGLVGRQVDFELMYSWGSRVLDFVDAGAPRLAVELFRLVDRWLRFRCRGDVIEQREQWLHQLLRQTLYRRSLLAAGALTDAYDQAATLLNACLADNHLLAGRIKAALEAVPRFEQGAAARATSEADQYALVVQAYARFDAGDLLATERLCRRVIQAGAGAGLDNNFRWASTLLAQAWAAQHRFEPTARAISWLRAARNEPDADIEAAAVELAFARPEADMAEALGGYQRAQEYGGLYYGNLGFRRCQLRAVVRGLVPDDPADPVGDRLARLRDEANADGFVAVGRQAELLLAEAVLQQSPQQAVDALVPLAGRLRGDGDLIALAEALTVLAEACCRIGRTEEAYAALAEAVPIAKAQGGRFQFRTLLDRIAMVVQRHPALRGRVAALLAVEPAAEEPEDLRRPVTEFTPLDRISDTAGWSDEEVMARLEVVRSRLDWANTTGSARKWWEAFENENRHRMPLVLRLAEELLLRKATVTEFFLAYVYSNTDNIQANLFYLDFTRLKKHEEKKKKAAAEGQPFNEPAPPRPPEPQPKEAISNTAGWDQEQILQRLASVKAQIDWDNTKDSARKWWEAFENENANRMPLVLRLAEELLVRNATITEFFLAYVYSNTDNLQANLHYLDFTRLKKEEERKKKEAAAAALAAQQPDK
jgi:hypothetical protein